MFTQQKLLQRKVARLFIAAALAFACIPSVLYAQNIAPTSGQINASTFAIGGTLPNLNDGDDNGGLSTQAKAYSEATRKTNCRKDGTTSSRCQQVAQDNSLIDNSSENVLGFVDPPVDGAGQKVALFIPSDPTGWQSFLNNTPAGATADYACPAKNVVVRSAAPAVTTKTTTIALRIGRDYRSGTGQAFQLPRPVFFKHMRQDSNGTETNNVFFAELRSLTAQCDNQVWSESVGTPSYIWFGTCVGGRWIANSAGIPSSTPPPLCTPIAVPLACSARPHGDVYWQVTSSNTRAATLAECPAGAGTRSYAWDTESEYRCNNGNIETTGNTRIANGVWSGACAVAGVDEVVFGSSCNSGPVQWGSQMFLCMSNGTTCQGATVWNGKKYFFGNSGSATIKNATIPISRATHDGMFCSSQSYDTSHDGAEVEFDVSAQVAAAGSIGGATIIIPVNAWDGIRTQAQANVAFANYQTDNNPFIDTNGSQPTKPYGINFRILDFNVDADYNVGMRPDSSGTTWYMNTGCGKNCSNNIEFNAHYYAATKKVVVSFGKHGRWKANGEGQGGGNASVDAYPATRDGHRNGKVWPEIRFISPLPAMCGNTTGQCLGGTPSVVEQVAGECSSLQKWSCADSTSIVNCSTGRIIDPQICEDQYVDWEGDTGGYAVYKYGSGGYSNRFERNLSSIE